MNEKLIKVYFGQDLLPYKDSERSVHFPIVGGAFLGASNTTKIRFYFDQIGDTSATYVSVAKLPNGKQGSQVLSKSSDDDGNYAELELSNWYTQAKGDVYIALQGYSGGVEYSYDSETELYEIHGTPIIQTTGSIKLAINYAPIGDSADYNDEFTTYQEILAGLGDKLDKKETSGLFAYTHDGSVQGEIKVAKMDIGGAIVQRNDNAQIIVPYTPSTDDNATSKKYVDDSIASAITSVYKYKGSVATYSDLPSSGLTIGDVYNVEETGDNYAWTGTTWDKLAGDIDLSDYATKDYVDTGLSGKQNTLVNQVNIKSINNQSLLGTGNIDIQGGSGGGVWGEITGDIQDQTDLQAEFQNVREVAEGKNQSIVVSYQQTAPSNDTQAQTFKKPDGTAFTSLSDFNTYVGSKTLLNSLFNSQNSDITHGDFYIIANSKVVYTNTYIVNNFKVGDIVLITQTDVPDRWVASLSSGTYDVASFYKLETTKIDLTNYATKTELDTAIDGVNDNIAPAYDNTVIYSIGDKVINENGELVSCLVNMTQAEEYDSTHWSQVSVARGFVDLDKAQVISGQKTFISEQNWGTSASQTYLGQIVPTSSGFELRTNVQRMLSLAGYGISCYANFNSSNLLPRVDNNFDIGNSSYRWKDLYLSGNVYVGNANSSYTSLKIYTTQYNNTFARGNTDKIRIGGTSTDFANRIVPFSDGTADLGVTYNRWGKLYIKDYLSDGNNSTYGLTIPDTTNFTANQEIATKESTLVATGTFSNGEFTIDTSVNPITDGLYLFTYGNAQAFIYINSTMLANSGTSPIRTCMPVIYGTNGETNAGMLRLSLSGTTLTVRVAVSGTQYARDGFTMSIYKSNLM